jgi:hypothetical protein
MSTPVVVPTVGVVSVPVEVETELVGEPSGIETVGESLDERPPVTVLAAATPASRRIAEMITAAFVISVSLLSSGRTGGTRTGWRTAGQARATLR